MTNSNVQKNQVKELSVLEMEKIQGGDLLDGVCAIVGATGMAMGIRYLVGAAVATTPFGAGALAVGAVACGGRKLGLW